MSTLKQIKDAVTADQISRQRDGSIMFRRSFYYRSASDAERFAARVTDGLDAAGIGYATAETGEHWAPFRGGQSIAKGSHYYVRVTLK